MPARWHLLVILDRYQIFIERTTWSRSRQDTVRWARKFERLVSLLTEVLFFGKIHDWLTRCGFLSKSLSELFGIKASKNISSF